MFEAETLHPGRSWPYTVLALAGTGLFIVVLFTGGWTTMWELFGDALGGRKVTDHQWQTGMGWAGIVSLCVAMYLVGFLNMARRNRERVWAHAMGEARKQPSRED